jgi:hypothetical protein
LASVPALETTSIPAIPPTVPATSSESVPVAASVQIPPSAVPPVFPEDVSSVHQTAVAPPNPEILRFVKMLAFGVPLMAVEQKMRAEGYDPSLLNSGKVDVTKAPPAPRSTHSSSDDDEESNSDDY